MRRVAALALPALLLTALQTAAQLPTAQAPAAQAVEAARRAREAALAAATQAQAQATARAAEADRLAAARVDAAAALHATEDQLSEISERIAALQSRHDVAAASARAQAARLGPLLPLVERLGLYPAETLLTVPATPEQALRGVIVLQGLARSVQAEVALLSDQQSRAATAAQALEEARRLQAATAAGQQAAAAALDTEVAQAVIQRNAAHDAATQAARQAADAAARTESLAAALATLDVRRRSARHPEPPPPGPELAAADAPGALPAGNWTVPVAGRLTRGFGSQTEAGSASGATFEAPPGARVVAPCPGRAVFAGPFRSYGQLLIVQCGGGLHAVLAGLGRLDAAVGQVLRAGEPVGIMAADGGTLYLEVRRDGIAIDPVQYLRRKG